LFGLPAVFYLSALFGLITVSSILCIPADAIDHEAARGVEGPQKPGEKVGAVQILLEDRRILVLAAALAFFHLGNAAMLPLFGVAVSAAGKGNPASLVAMTIIVAQAVMCLVSIVAARLIEARGYWLILMISFLALPIRGVVAAKWLTVAGVYPVQILDGIGAGLQSVAVPGLATRLLAGTGRVNVGQGALMTAQGVGAALSPAIGGWLAQLVGWSPMFLALGALSAVSVILWIPMARRMESK
jgi:MFS family permease